MASNSNEGNSEDNFNTSKDEKENEKIEGNEPHEATQNCTKGVERTEKKIVFKQVSSDETDAKAAKQVFTENGSFFKPWSHYRKKEEYEFINSRFINCQYKRNQPKDRIHENYTMTSHYNDTYNNSYHRNKSIQEDAADAKLGCWCMIVAMDEVQRNGMTPDYRRLRISINEMYSKYKDVFVKPPEFYERKEFSQVFIYCFTSDYTDRCAVSQTATIIRKNLLYSCSLSYFTPMRQIIF